jgi:hypothetical protein
VRASTPRSGRSRRAGASRREEGLDETALHVIDRRAELLGLVEAYRGSSATSG